MEYPYSESGCRQEICEFSYKGETLYFKDELVVDEEVLDGRPKECLFADAFSCENKAVEKEVNDAFAVWGRAWAKKTPYNDRFPAGLGAANPPLEEFVKLIKGKLLRSEPRDYPIYDENGDMIIY